MSEQDKKTLVFGASLKPERYSHLAVKRLLDNGFPVVAIGGRSGYIEDVEIRTGTPYLDNIHTITLYMGKRRQEEYMSYLLSLQPKRIIFNPGAENHDLAREAKSLGIETLNACTLVMLGIGDY